MTANTSAASKPIGTFLSIQARSEGGHWATINGVSLPSGTTVHAMNNVSIALKVPGHKYFIGQGIRGYKETTIQIFQILETRSACEFKVQPLMEYPARQKSAK